MNQIRKIEEAIGEIIFHAHPENEPVTIEYIPPHSTWSVTARMQWSSAIRNAKAGF